MPSHGSRRLRYAALALLCGAALALGVVLANLSQPARSPVDTTMAWIKAVNVGNSPQIGAMTIDHDLPLPNLYPGPVYRGPHCWFVVRGGECQPAGLIGRLPYRSAHCVSVSSLLTTATVDCVVAFRDASMGTQDEVVTLARTNGDAWRVDSYSAS